MARQATGSVRYQGGRWWARITAHGRRALVAIEPPLTDPEARERAEAEARVLSGLARRMPRPGAPGELAEDWFRVPDVVLELSPVARGWWGWRAESGAVWLVPVGEA